MKKELSRYCVNPGVVCAGKISRVTVIPLDAGLYFSSSEEYGVFILPLTRRRKYAAATPDFICRGEGGVISFEYLFEREEEYFIKLYPIKDGDSGSLIVRLSIYAVADDLFYLKPLKGDLHIHTSHSDGKDEPGILAANYRRYGFDFIAVTDHNRYFPSLEAQDVFGGLKSGLTILNGEEVHTPGSFVHIVHVGGKQSIAELYVKQGEAYASEAAEIESSLPDVPYKKELALAMWATQKIHKAGGIAIFPHPYWIPNVYNVPDVLTDMLLTGGMFDAYELIGGMGVSGNNLSTARYCELRERGLKIPVVSSSDSHGTIDCPRFNELYTVLFAKENESDAILEAVKSGLCAAVETIRGTGGNEYKVYGSYRLVSYARYLIDNYFPLYTEICAVEGKFIRNYLLGFESTPDMIEPCAQRARAFYERFFGLLPAVKPTPRSIESSEKWKKVWGDYGVTKRGSEIL